MGASTHLPSYGYFFGGPWQRCTCSYPFDARVWTVRLSAGAGKGQKRAFPSPIRGAVVSLQWLSLSKDFKCFLEEGEVHLNSGSSWPVLVHAHL